VKVLSFGTYDRASPRNTQVLSCLRGAGITVVERHRTVWGRHNWSPGPRTLVRLARAELALSRDRPDDCDVVLVGYPGHADLAAARRVARGRPVVFNPLVSLADTLVADRAVVSRGSAPAAVLRGLDRYAFRRADLVVADTGAHAAYFREAFGLPAERVAVALVGAEDGLFRPEPTEPAVFHALFVGKLIPLHGLETILAAAALAPELRFRIVGSGQLDRLLGDRPANVDHVPWVDYELLPAELHRASCALGIFGTSAKAQRVIPNKVFQALACGTPVVTADTAAARELLRDQESALLVPSGDPEALAGALRRLAAEPALAERLSAAGLAAYRERASEAVLGARWREIIASLL
jgi:glycosyltransferase involved in cell wall biosynthesis